MVALVGGARAARALSVHAVYRTACAREVGVILRVERREIQLLRLDGTLARIPRHEIVSLLSYPVAQLPTARLPIPPGFPPLRVTTRFDDQVVELVTGWPIDYSEEQISFLLRDGKELVVDRESLWSLAFDPSDDLAATTAVASPPLEAVTFAHPQTAGFCVEPGAPTSQPTTEPTSRPAVRQVFAQQILNDQIVIRRELDRLREGYEQLLEYEQDQKFYPTPFLYQNRTMLGLWVSAFSRYGASTTRSNNFTPLLVDELALGPFRYQHLFLSGAAPNEMLLHHEAQSQIFYRFKAAYFHTSVFFDPNLLLVGTKYAWRAADLEDERLDDRLNESLAIELGFDYGPLSIELAPAVLGQSAVKVGTFFDEEGGHNLLRGGVRLTFATVRVHALFGALTTRDGRAEQRLAVGGMTEDVLFDTVWRHRYARLNLGWRPRHDLDLGLSTIVRGLSYEARAFVSGVDPIAYDALSVSTALTGALTLRHRFSLGANAIVEVQRREARGFGEGTRVFPRLGLFAGFWF